MVERKLFHVSHLDLIQVKPEYRELLNSDKVKFVLSNIPGGEQGDALTVMIDGRVVACFGYFLILPGVVEVWLLPSVYVHDHAIIFVKLVRRYLEQTANVFGWHRIQTVTKATSEHRRWMNVLGFCEEGIMKKYLNKEDYVMSARYFERG